MKRLTVALAAAALSVRPALASDPTVQDRFRVSYDVGALVSLGRQPNLVDDGMLVGVTLSYDVSPFASVLGSFSRTGASADGFGDDRNVYLYDVGVQGQYPVAMGGDLFLTPFAGVGGGGRSSDFRGVDGRRDGRLTGYVAVGGRLELSFASIGVTARDYVSAFHASGTAGSSPRNDLAVFASASVRF